MMRQHPMTWFVAVAVIALGCASDRGDAAGSVAAIDSLDPIGTGAPVPLFMIDAGRNGIPSQTPEQNEPVTEEGEAPEECAATECGEGHSCCWADGQCYPDSCLDCCPSEDDRALPRFVRMDTGSIPRDDLAGPRPPPDFTPAGPRPPGPGSPDPGPMPATP
ncbi:MAG: hypothetical protein EVA89_21140 [Sandaracinaceae bacterium]|nr:MAG: hypothetical protein EVA89_21140 [Sandaracinaceae bacterium]